ncbi:MAG: hypothetical protein IPL63_13955 [Saprospiraceae bacterium]|nr:hypothetical protein [Saprospiraceae bacterium]
MEFLIALFLVITFIQREKIMSWIKPVIKNSPELQQDSLPANPESNEEVKPDADEVEVKPLDPIIIYKNDTIKESGKQEKNVIKKDVPSGKKTVETPKDSVLTNKKITVPPKTIEDTKTDTIKNN